MRPCKAKLNITNISKHTINHLFRYQCKYTGCGKEFRVQTSFSRHKKSCKHNPQCKNFLGATKQNPQLEHTLAETRKDHIADRSSVGQQDHLSDDYLPENFNIGSPDINILDYCYFAAVGATEGNPQLGHTLADTRNHHIADQSSVGQQDHSSDDYLPENFNIGSPDINILDYCDFAALGPDIVTLFSE
ncbi:hypothetical protein LOAG_12915 [Loa loa]|uniref:C2H2-type domain-containing protein n=1 Tax=Loa loa TaxID=7209 RepID=A0A1S0TKF0_LOALO|nr:hypothetical protein LOAG_12915 [Loa loa]EFO15594.2 hypothetical protein LOAG_12915 [Loa loa]